MKLEDMIPMGAYLVTYRWRAEPVTMYPALDVPVTGIEHWKDSDPKHYVMMHRFGSDRNFPIALDMIERKPRSEPTKCSHCGSQRGWCVQCRPDQLSY